MATLDFENKTILINDPYYVTGDQKVDFEYFHNYFKDVKGKNPDQFDPKAKYHDAKSDPENPRWYCVDVTFEEAFDAVVPLTTLKETKGLEKMMVTQRGARLSVQPVTKAEFDIVVRLGRAAS